MHFLEEVQGNVVILLCESMKRRSREFSGDSHTELQLLVKRTWGIITHSQSKLATISQKLIVADYAGNP